jgi:protein TonB
MVIVCTALVVIIAACIVDWGSLFAPSSPSADPEPLVHNDDSLTSTVVDTLNASKTEVEPVKPQEVKQTASKTEVEPVKPKPVKASIAFTVPDIVEEVDETKALKSQQEVTRSNIAIASQDYVGDTEDGINIDDLKDNQMAGGDEVPPAEDEILENIVEQKAQFPGGENALLKFVADNLKYPSIALEQELQGIVIVRFVVEKDGSVGDVTVRKSLSEECDAAAIKVVKQLPKFIPAKSQGNPVRVWYTLPIRFRIT